MAQDLHTNPGLPEDAMTTAVLPVETLAAALAAQVEARPGRLAWARVSCPEPALASVRTSLPEVLAEMGIDFVDLEVVPDPMVAVLDTRWDHGWA
jgi:hypothetical protein